MTNTPVIFTAFSNPHNDLQLTKEQNGIQDVLQDLEGAGKIKHLLRTDTDLDAWFNFMRQWENQICIFHYAGHANSEGLSLQNAHTSFEHLAQELVLRNPTSLQLVFLNGCSTQKHVEILRDLGVSAVIATSSPIDDKIATKFAIRFYENLATGDSIETAYISASNYAKGASTEQRFRNLGTLKRWADITGIESSADNFAWGLYAHDGVQLQNKTLNNILPSSAGKEETITAIPVPQTLAQFKLEMLNLVDELKFQEVFDKIKNSSYTYQKFLLNKTEQEMAFGTTLQQVNSLKVFIGTLKEK